MHKHEHENIQVFIFLLPGPLLELPSLLAVATSLAQPGFRALYTESRVRLESLGVHLHSRRTPSRVQVEFKRSPNGVQKESRRSSRGLTWSPWGVYKESSRSWQGVHQESKKTLEEDNTIYSWFISLYQQSSHNIIFVVNGAIQHH